jgi:hypothetical protein
VANWFGLDQSKYQWALNDYYEATGKVSASPFLIREAAGASPFRFWLESRSICVSSFALPKLLF